MTGAGTDMDMSDRGAEVDGAAFNNTVLVFSMTDAPTELARDCDAILGSACFRRLAGKTQVFVAPRDPALRTRLTHTLEVAAAARTIARALGAVEGLCEAIALGHDVGHPAFGHAGERALAHLAPGGFHHASHGVRVITELERRGQGLGLDPRVVDGIAKHSKGRSGAVIAKGPALAATTIEARIVRAADLYAYAFHDLDDAARLGLVRLDDVPRSARAVLGDDPESIRATLLLDTIRASSLQAIALPPATERALAELRAHLYEHLYEGPLLRRQTEHAKRTVEGLFDACVRDEERVARLAGRTPSGDASAEQRAVDLIASLTDLEALDLHASLIGARDAA